MMLVIGLKPTWDVTFDTEERLNEYIKAVKDYGLFVSLEKGDDVYRAKVYVTTGLHQFDNSEQAEEFINNNQDKEMVYLKGEILNN